MQQASDRVKSAFEKKISSFIQMHGLLESGDRVLVALSGGSDSVCLIKALYELKEKFNISITAAHVNHMIRGDEADRDEQFCKELCADMGILLECIREDVPRIAREKKKSIELAAREVRYKFFDAIAEKYGINKVATAHNKNDNAETVIMNFMRGSGIYGLCGIDVKRERIIRPLLCMEKSEITDYIRACDMSYVTDSTNLVDDYTRNKVRLKLIPFIEEEFNPAIAATVSRSCEVLKADCDFLDGEAERLFSDYVITDAAKTFIEFDRLKKLHSAIRYRIIRKAVAKVRGIASDIGLDTVKRIDTAQRGRVNVIGGLWAEVSYGRLYFVNDSEDGDYEYELDLEGKVYIKEDNSFVVCEITDKSQVRKEKNCVYFDADSVGKMRIRNRRDGDRIRTEAGSKKLKDLFIDKKIPVFKRRFVPLIECDGNILWVCSVQRCSEFKINANTKRVIKLSYIGEEEK